MEITNRIKNHPINNNMPKCYYCNSDLSYFSMILYSCECEKHIHYDCLVKLIKKSGDTCKKCMTKFRTNVPRYKIINNSTKISLEDKIFFPFDDYYPHFLNSMENLRCETIFTKIDFAIIYLQPERLKELLSMIDHTTFVEYLRADTNLRSAMFNDSPFNLELQIILPSHYIKMYNQEVYAEVENILKSKMS